MARNQMRLGIVTGSFLRLLAEMIRLTRQETNQRNFGAGARSSSLGRRRQASLDGRHSVGSGIGIRAKQGG